MKKDELVNKTLKNIKKLPKNKVEEVNNFIEFLLSRIDNQLINDEIQNLVMKSDTYVFLKDEPEIYSVNDIKEKYNAKR